MTRAHSDDGIDIWRAFVILLLGIIALPALLFLVGCFAALWLPVVGIWL